MGEIVDMGVMMAVEGWESPAVRMESEQCVSPVEYRMDVVQEERLEEIAIRAGAIRVDKPTQRRIHDNFAAPIGKLVPSEIPPILPMEGIAPDEIHDMCGGRWLYDFGKAISGMLHFDAGSPVPIVPEDEKYPRAHGFEAASEQGESFITIIYGESLEVITGDINRVIVAGLELHDGDPRHRSSSEGATDGAPCFPDDRDGILLSQRDVFVFSKRRSRLKRAFANVRQSHITTHGFRFAEMCCTAKPPMGVRALMYRTVFAEWGAFASSNVLINASEMR